MPTGLRQAFTSFGYCCYWGSRWTRWIHVHFCRVVVSSLVECEGYRDTESSRRITYFLARDRVQRVRPSCRVRLLLPCRCATLKWDYARRSGTGGMVNFTESGAERAQWSSRARRRNVQRLSSSSTVDTFRSRLRTMAGPAECRSSPGSGVLARLDV